MDDSRVFAGLLRGLEHSPLWPWGAPPTLWAVLCEEPTVIVPALTAENIDTMILMAQAWREQMPADSVHVDTLCLVAEGESPLSEFREAVVGHRDGEMHMMRQVRGETPFTVDLMEHDSPAVEAMRQIAAASWR